MHRYILLITFAIILFSCERSEQDYDILNNFLRNEHIKIENLSSESLDFNEFKNYEEFSEIIKYIPANRQKINISKVTEKYIKEGYCKTTISKPIFYNGELKKAVIFLEINCSSKHNISISRKVYFISRYKNDWYVEKEIENYSVS